MKGKTNTETSLLRTHRTRRVGDRGQGPHFTSVSQSAGLDSACSDVHQSGPNHAGRTRVEAQLPLPIWTPGDGPSVPSATPRGVFCRCPPGDRDTARWSSVGWTGPLKGLPLPPHLWLTLDGVISGSNLFRSFCCCRS